MPTTYTRNPQTQFSQDVKKAYDALMSDNKIIANTPLEKVSGTGTLIQQLKRLKTQYSDSVYNHLMDDKSRINNLATSPNFKTALKEADEAKARAATQKLFTALADNFNETAKKIQLEQLAELNSVAKAAHAAWDDLDAATKANSNQQNFVDAIVDQVKDRQKTDLTNLSKRYNELQTELNQRITQGYSHYSKFANLTSPADPNSVDSKFFSVGADGSFNNPENDLLDAKTTKGFALGRPLLNMKNFLQDNEQYDNSPMLVDLRNLLALKKKTDALAAENQVAQTLVKVFGLSKDYQGSLDAFKLKYGLDPINGGFNPEFSFTTDQTTGQITGGTVQYDMPLKHVPIKQQIDDWCVLGAELAKTNLDPIDLIPMLLTFPDEEIAFKALKEVAKAIWAENPDANIDPGFLQPQQQAEWKVVQAKSERSHYQTLARQAHKFTDKPLPLNSFQQTFTPPAPQSLKQPQTTSAIIQPLTSALAQAAAGSMSQTNTSQANSSPASKSP